MVKNKKIALKSLSCILVLLAVTGCSVFGIRSEEQPPYEVLYSDGNIDIRQYGSFIVARTEVEGSYSDSSSVAFRRIAGYIFGKNKKKQKMSMTAPVVQEKKNQDIPMTAPVIQEKKGSAWTMSFVMPSKFTLGTLPEPLDPKVTLAQVPGRKVAVIRYSGFLSEENIIEQSRVLMKWLEKKGYQAISPPRSAGYDPPWTLPFLRRNEVHVDVK